MKKITVVELFAGVGGFRLGLERANKNAFDFVFVNQWEPNEKMQHAFNCYVNNFGNENAINENIVDAKNKIPNNPDLIVGGFPCQDYSVAATNAKGIEGKKGVLWWEISWIIENKNPRFLLLENVDRLLKSPSSLRGRDFAIMLIRLHKLGYNAEWQVINAADYGMVQRRRRIFIFIWKQSESKYKKSIFEKHFKSTPKIEPVEFDLIDEYPNEIDASNNYKKGKFLNKGTFINGIVRMYDYNPVFNGKKKILNDVLLENFDKKYFLSNEQIEKMKYLKGKKSIERIRPNGEKYFYTEGSMSFYDDINKQARTIITSETSMNRSTHIIKVKNKYRFITPIEAERINGFPDNWTETIASEKKRYFCMGNALVIEIIERLAKSIIDLF
ncbi:DNA (cytosine-5-)-methyltransferase [Spiroplasma tabanidicola]|uniref:Cytosine-specific methyltransferase n=1 Tax=Spiroplasma tabanidicola TaxID=324079 RepID=A0A6I6CCJ7_9MOLU|nr:DNA (cytosine-5-)-methyltransferase [Spiroplasma tabanidicola]QGS51852.1 DNA (cytosine-5)-methyltransferase 1 [Spiroplasma tabanidicola]